MLLLLLLEALGGRTKSMVLGELALPTGRQKEAEWWLPLLPPFMAYVRPFTPERPLVATEKKRYLLQLILPLWKWTETSMCKPTQRHKAVVCVCALLIPVLCSLMREIITRYHWLSWLWKRLGGSSPTTFIEIRFNCPSCPFLEKETQLNFATGSKKSLLALSEIYQQASSAKQCLWQQKKPGSSSLAQEMGGSYQHEVHKFLPRINTLLIFCQMFFFTENYFWQLALAIHEQTTQRSTKRSLLSTHPCLGPQQLLGCLCYLFL